MHPQQRWPHGTSQRSAAKAGTPPIPSRQTTMPQQEQQFATTQ